MIILANKPKEQKLKYTLKNKDLQEQFKRQWMDICDLLISWIKKKK